MRNQKIYQKFSLNGKGSVHFFFGAVNPEPLNGFSVYIPYVKLRLNSNSQGLWLLKTIRFWRKCVIVYPLSVMQTFETLVSCL